MKALITLPGSQAGVRTIPPPTPSPTQILVRVKAIALNPVDALYVAKPAAPPGRVVGSDFAGVVVSSPIGRWKAGGRVAGFLHGACQENELPGAFAEFLAVDSDLVYGVPDDMSFEDAATLPLCVQTAANGIFRVLSLLKPWEEAAPPSPTTPRPVILIYSGATSVGCYAIQLAKLSPTNPLIITTASPSNKSYLESLGADHVVDYHDNNWVAQVQEFVTTNNAELRWALDCISEGETVSKISGAFTTPGGKIATVRGPTQWAHDLKAGVEAQYMAVWTMLGKEFWYNGGIHFPVEPSHRALAAALYAYISSDNAGSPLITGVLKPNRVRLMDGGLEEVPNAFTLLGAGKVTERKVGVDMRPLKAEKIVYRLGEEDS